MNGFYYKEHPHKRLNILTGEWVLVSPHRDKRPWQGKLETVVADDRPMYDSGYLCPGNKRADGTVNPKFNGTNTFANDFSALLKDVPQGQYNVGNLIKASSESGVCKVIKTSFPYSAGMHQAPVNDGEHPEWHWHMHFYPPLPRSATVKKFMVGYEMLANPQRDISPEWAAEKLRSLPGVHYKLNDKAAEFVK